MKKYTDLTVATNREKFLKRFFKRYPDSLFHCDSFTPERIATVMYFRFVFGVIDCTVSQVTINKFGNIWFYSLSYKHSLLFNFITLEFIGYD